MHVHTALVISNTKGHFKSLKYSKSELNEPISETSKEIASVEPPENRPYNTEDVSNQSNCYKR